MIHGMIHGVANGQRIAGSDRYSLISPEDLGSTASREEGAGSPLGRIVLMFAALLPPLADT
jgi:hypothetical protein